MHKVIGYGEDALTYRTLTKDLVEILKRLEDSSDPSSCLLIYRPSFGRGSSSEKSATFGEFDAILATPKSVYLIESKWQFSSEIIKGSAVKLREEQLLRHKIFSWYFKHWEKNSNWTDFVRKNEKQFEGEFKDKKKKIAPIGSRLSENLEYLLNLLHGYSGTIKNVLLVINSGEGHLQVENPNEFILITLDIPKSEYEPYFEID